MDTKEIIICDCDVIHQEIVEERRRGMAKEEELNQIALFFRVLGDSTRVRIMWALVAGELCVCDLAFLLNMTKSAISHQLRALRDARLVRFRKEGKIVFYSLDDHHVQEVFERGFEHIKENNEPKGRKEQ